VDVLTKQPLEASKPDNSGQTVMAGEFPVDPGETLASLLITSGKLTADQLKYARRVRSKLGVSKTLFNVLKDLGYVTEEEVREALSESPTAIRLGDLLVELGRLARAQLEAALKMQAAESGKRKLGEILIEGRFIEDSKIAEVLSLQFGIPQVDLRSCETDRTLVTTSTLKTCVENSFIPVRREGGRVLVAFCDPTDRKSRTTAERLFGADLIRTVTTRQAFLEASASYERGLQVAVAAVETGAVRMVEDLFGDAMREGASDIHIEPAVDRVRIRFRCDGVLVPYKDIRKDEAASFCGRIKVLAQADISEKRRHQDGRIFYEDRRTGETVDMRASFFASIHGQNIVLRLLTKKGSMLELQDIGMAPRMLEHFRDDALDLPSGVIMITGPTGSGKTTTLYSCVNYLNDSQTSIITAEDPVEYVVDGIAQCSINPKLKVTFEETLRHIVRQDPDVIVLGEIRDRFSADTAIQAALTGHKVLTTFHTEDSIGGLLRLLNMDIEAFLISSTVVCVIAQRLLRKVCKNCARPYHPTALDLRRLGYESGALPEVSFKLGSGCAHCRYTGYKGRVSAFELLVLSEGVKDAILSRKTSYEIRRISLESSGLVTLLEDGLVKAAREETSLQEVLHHLPRLHKPRPFAELRRLTGH